MLNTGLLGPRSNKQNSASLDDNKQFAMQRYSGVKMSWARVMSHSLSGCCYWASLFFLFWSGFRHASQYIRYPFSLWNSQSKQGHVCFNICHFKGQALESRLHLHEQSSTGLQRFKVVHFCQRTAEGQCGWFVLVYHAGVGLLIFIKQKKVSKVVTMT